jgi:hypothetical protein
MARPIRRAPPVTRATPRPEVAESVNPAELDEVHQGHDGDEAEDDAERQHGDPPVSPRLRGRRGAVQAGDGGGGWKGAEVTGGSDPE